MAVKYTFHYRGWTQVPGRFSIDPESIGEIEKMGGLCRPVLTREQLKFKRDFLKEHIECYGSSAFVAFQYKLWKLDTTVVGTLVKIDFDEPPDCASGLDAIALARAS